MISKLVIIDYGMGNIQSVSNALSFLGQSCTVSSNLEEIAKADAYILPGVGAFAQAMKNLKSRNLIETLTEAVLERKRPFLGICLGMQLIAESSEEMGMHDGLGWIPAKVKHIQPRPGFRVPHVAWNDIKIVSQNPLFDKIPDRTNYYFDHSYHFVCDEKYVSAYCEYGAPFVAAIQNKNITAVQFHPEKSQILGLKLLRNFLNFIKQC